MSDPYNYDDDSVPVFDRGKDYFPPDPFDTGTEVVPEDNPVRTCPKCSSTFSLVDTEVGYIDKFGNAVFFCSETCKGTFHRNDDDVPPEALEFSRESFDRGEPTGFKDDDLWHPERDS